VPVAVAALVDDHLAFAAGRRVDDHSAPRAAGVDDDAAATAPAARLEAPAIAVACPASRLPDGAGVCGRLPVAAGPHVAVAVPLPVAADPDLAGRGRRAGVLDLRRRRRDG